MSTGNKICLPESLKCTWIKLLQSVTVMRAEKAEKLNGRTAMLGFAAALISYATSGSVFFFGILGF